LFTNTHGDEKLFKMKVKKQSCSDNDDRLTIEDVVQLGGDQVGVILLSINIFTVCRHGLPKNRRSPQITVFS